MPNKGKAKKNGRKRKQVEKTEEQADNSTAIIMESLYASSTVQVEFGGQKFNVHDCLWKGDINFDGDKWDARIGHIVIHFLYTGILDLGYPARPFEESLMVYCFARQQGLCKLGTLAMKEAQCTSPGSSTANFFDALRKAYSFMDNPASETWLSGELVARVEHSLADSPEIFSQPSSQNSSGQATNFDWALICALVEILRKRDGRITAATSSCSETFTGIETPIGSTSSAQTTTDLDALDDELYGNGYGT
ncbi:hypothetical protein LOZ65_006805 [Ophidiomyces ophidiicola]|nr:hypothetical protein LOZ65_006805 [Ophidiomyces ophidiicola]